MSDHVADKRSRDHLRDSGHWHGSRCRLVLSAHEPNVIAASIGMSMLKDLLVVADLGLLTPDGIRTYIDAYRIASGVEERIGPMGHTYYVPTEEQK